MNVLRTLKENGGSLTMGFGCNYDQNENEHYDRNYPAVDADGYVENWWKRALDDNESED